MLVLGRLTVCGETAQSRSDRLNVPGDRKPIMYARGISTLDQLIERVDAWKQGGSPVEYYILGDGAGTEPLAGMIHIAVP